MLPSRLLRVVVAALAVAVVACGDPTRPTATFTNVRSAYTLYALTGTPANVPNALLFLTGVTRATSEFNFDVAFDIDASGKTVIYPVRTVGSGLAGTLKRVGLQVLNTSFESVREVPNTGYDTLKVQTVSPGTVLAVEMRDGTACFSTFNSQLIYAKMIVDSVSSATRRIYLRTVVDPNCGYRSVVPDSVPTH